jgi:hypothetical protein
LVTPLMGMWLEVLGERESAAGAEREQHNAFRS